MPTKLNGVYSTKREAAEQLGADISTVQKYLKNGLLPGVKIEGMGWLIEEKEITKLIKPANGRPPFIKGNAG